MVSHYRWTQGQVVNAGASTSDYGTMNELEGRTVPRYLNTSVRSSNQPLSTTEMGSIAYTNSDKMFWSPVTPVGYGDTSGLRQWAPLPGSMCVYVMGSGTQSISTSGSVVLCGTVLKNVDTSGDLTTGTPWYQTANNRFVPYAAGFYEFSYSVTLGAGTSGVRQAYLRANGSAINGSGVVITTGTEVCLSKTFTTYIDTSTYIEFVAQSSVAVNSSAGQNCPTLAIKYVGARV